MKDVKLAVLQDGYALFWCPACNEAHAISLAPGAWTNSGDAEVPVTQPSILISGRNGAKCHCYLEGKSIRFCSDSPHALAGQTVDLPSFPHDHHIQGWEWNADGDIVPSASR